MATVFLMGELGGSPGICQKRDGGGYRGCTPGRTMQWIRGTHQHTIPRNSVNLMEKKIK